MYAAANKSMRVHTKVGHLSYLLRLHLQTNCMRLHTIACARRQIAKSFRGDVSEKNQMHRISSPLHAPLLLLECGYNGP